MEPLLDTDSAFERATNSIRDCTITDSRLLLRLYGLYKQATVGDCNIPKPSYLNFTARQKWEAWDSLRSTSQSEAKGTYADLVGEIQAHQSDSPKSSTMGVAVSCMRNTDQELGDSQKTIFDWVKEGNVTRVSHLLLTEPSLALGSDEEGLTLLHWAADRGDARMISLLASNNCDLNAVDHSGQTALHYASSCGHAHCVRVLQERGANPAIRDNDGNLAEHVRL